jgi:uncharacterized protein YbjT (DUF2867 family)
MTILVIGGGSRTGAELLRLLHRAGAAVRVLTRDKEPTDPDGVTGDLARPDSLIAAMAGVTKVFLLSSAAHDELAWHRHAIDAAVQNHVTHLVRSSMLGADPRSAARFIRHHGRADAHLRASGVPYTILRPNMYMHNVSALWPARLDQDGTYYAPAGDARISMTDARDVAAVAARALLDDGHTGMTYDVTGPAAVSHKEACDLLTAHLGRPVRYVPAADNAARTALMQAGFSRWFADALIEHYQDYRRSGAAGYAAQVHDTVRKVTGSAARGLQQFLAGEPRAGNAANQLRVEESLVDDAAAVLDPGRGQALIPRQVRDRSGERAAVTSEFALGHVDGHRTDLVLR